MTRRDAAALCKPDIEIRKPNRSWLYEQPQAKPKSDYFSMIGGFCIGVIVTLAAIGSSL